MLTAVLWGHFVMDPLSDRLIQARLYNKLSILDDKYVYADTHDSLLWNVDLVCDWFIMLICFVIGLYSE